MESNYQKHRHAKILGLVLLFVLGTTLSIFAQKRGGNKGGGSRPSTGHSGSQQRPSPSSRPSPGHSTSPQRPSPGTRPSPGHSTSPQRPSRPSTGHTTRPQHPSPGHSTSRPGHSTSPQRPGNGHNNNHSNNKTNIHGGNRTNVNRGNKTVNVNVNNRRNVSVRRNVYRPYTRPPRVYGGRRYYSYHPYYYHPYRPYGWGPAYHPWGFFIAAVATTAIIVSVESHQYHYDQGVYYAPSNGGYTVVQAPVGAVITTLPTGYQTVVVSGSGGTTVNNYYYGGTYYERESNGYKVVPPTAGTIITDMPAGGKEVRMGDVTYVQVGDTYYQPIQQNGQNVYEVVDVEAAD
jgi:hypothetical protein